MIADLVANRTRILGFIAALGIVAPLPAAGDVTRIDPDGTRIAPDPIGGLAGSSTNTRQSSGELDPSFAGDGTTWSYLPGYDGGSFVLDEAGNLCPATPRSVNMRALASRPATRWRASFPSPR